MSIYTSMASSVRGKRGSDLRVQPGGADTTYCTIFSESTGFLARVEGRGAHEPLWAPRGPELLDISITNWCDRGCARCYRSSDRKGLHMSLRDYEMVLAQAAESGVLQVALGGGNPNQHPDFVRILESTSRLRVTPNYTTSGRGLTGAILDASSRYCGAVAVSVYEPLGDVSEAVAELHKAGVKVNLHFVLTRESIQVALAWLRDPPRLLQYVNAVIFLTFKPLGRGGDSSLMLRRDDVLCDFIDLASTGEAGFRIGFDSCMASAFVDAAPQSLVWLDGCEAARFSMYISERLLAYPCSFMEGALPGVVVKADNLTRIWREAAQFRATRAKLANVDCMPCPIAHICRGGCPSFKAMSLCGA